MKQITAILIVVTLLIPGWTYAAPSTSSPLGTIQSLWHTVLDWVETLVGGEVVQPEAPEGDDREKDPPLLEHGGYVDPVG